MTETMIGAYGEWAASLRRGKLPELSFRRDEFTSVDAWRPVARARVLDRLAAPEIPTPESVETLEVGELDGVRVERLRWQLPFGPPTDAVCLRPAAATGRLPGVLALHCHGGRKCWGWKKVASAGNVELFMG